MLKAIYHCARTKLPTALHGVGL